MESKLASKEKSISQLRASIHTFEDETTPNMQKMIDPQKSLKTELCVCDVTTRLCTGEIINFRDGTHKDCGHTITASKLNVVI